MDPPLTVMDTDERGIYSCVFASIRGYGKRGVCYQPRMDTNKEYLLVCIHLYSWLFVSIRARFHETSAPLQEDPEPAVQPKQWLPTAIGRSLSC